MSPVEMPRPVDAEPACYREHETCPLHATVEGMLRALASMRESARNLRDQAEMIQCVAAGGEAHARDIPEPHRPYHALMTFRAIKALGEDASDLICIEDELATMSAEIEAVIARAKSPRAGRSDDANDARGEGLARLAR